MSALRKAKGKVSKLARKAKKKTRPVSKSVLSRKRPAVKVSEKPEVKPMAVEQLTVERTKFSTPDASRSSSRMMEELPRGYGNDRIVLQVRDPWWLHSYWEIVSGTMDQLKATLKERFSGAKLVLRIYDISLIIFNGSNAHRFFDIELPPGAESWYIDTGSPGKSWCADIGLRLANGDFITIARSNTVTTPIAGPSWITDEEWMIPDEMFARLYGMGFGFGKSSPVGRGWQERIASSGMPSSPGSPARLPQKAKGFWLVVNTELVVYGATEPNATLTVQGREVKLKPDGTFSLRFAFPDGKQTIPVVAVSADKKETRTVTAVVNKETK